MRQYKIINFPLFKGRQKRCQHRKRRTTRVNEIRYFTEKQIKLLRRTVRGQAELDRKKDSATGIREWMVVDLLTSTGLRVGEVTDIRCVDLRIGYDECEIFVRNGKGGTSRYVQIPKGLKQHLKQFLKWKEQIGESTDDEVHLFIGQRGAWTNQAVQQIVKKYLRALGLYETGKSVHALRHSYAVHLYRHKRGKRDLRAVQKQLGHRSIQSTQIYADVLKEDIQDQIKGLWN